MKILITESQYKKLIKEIDDESTKIDVLNNIVDYVREKTSNVNDVRKLTPSVIDTLEKDYEVYYTELKKNNPKTKEKDLVHSFNRYCFRHWHQGIDVGGKSNLDDKILFKKPFEVVSGPSGKGNNCFSLKTEDGLKHTFCHSEIVYVKEGEKYPGNTVIALVGNKGNSTAPHVHYEIREGYSVKEPEYLDNNWENYWGLLDKSVNINTTSLGSKLKGPDGTPATPKGGGTFDVGLVFAPLKTFDNKKPPDWLIRQKPDGVNMSPLIKKVVTKPAGMRNPIESICDDTISNLIKPDMDEENIVSGKDNENNNN